MLERNGHGGDWATAAETFAGGSATEIQWLDYSANINPLGPPSALKEMLLNEWGVLTRYPDPEVRELREAISIKYDIPTESVIAGNGAAELIDLIVRALGIHKTAVTDPTFSEYREAAEKSGSEVISVPSSEDIGFCVPLTKLIDILPKVDALFLGQPNNPTGGRWSKEALAELIRHAEEHGTKLILDEAFVDFYPDEQDVTMIHEASASSTVVVIRSMTKFYAIPGLRLGYVVAEPSMIRAMKRLQVPWSVNHLAQKAGVLALQDLEYEQRTRQLIIEEREWLSRSLTRLGCRVFDGSANFLLVKLGREHTPVDQLQYQLGLRGILIRRCTTFIGLDDRYFRIAVRTRFENERLIEALESVFTETAGIRHE